MRCRREKEALLYSCSMLSQPEKERFEEHLAGCAECAAVVEREKKTAGLFRESYPAADAAGLEDRIIYAVKNKAARGSVADRATAAFMRRLAPVAAVLAAMMLFVTILLPNRSDNEMVASSSGDTYYAGAVLSGADSGIFSEDSNTAYSSFISEWTSAVSGSGE